MRTEQTIAWKPFSQKHKDYIKNALSCRMNVAEGAIRSGKTIDNCIIAAAFLEQCPDKIHLASGSTVGNAKLNIGACNGFGLENLFRGRCKWGKYKDNEALFIETQTGSKVLIFTGGGKADSYRRILGNSYGMWIATEINEHYDGEDSRTSFIKVAFGRQAAAEKQLILWDLNPCSPGHKIYTNYVDKYLEDFLGGYQYRHFIMDDNLSISQQRKEEIKSQYDVNSIWYKRDIQGERCIAEGLVYPNFNRDKHIVKAEDIIRAENEAKGKVNGGIAEDDGLYYISIDYGTANPCSMGLWRIADDKAVRVKEYYHNSRETKKQLTDEEYHRALVNLAGDRVIQYVVVDPSAASFIETIRRHGKFDVRHAVNDVLDGIRVTASLLSADKIFIDESCEDAIKEFGLYSWDEKATDEDKPLKENDHACITGDSLIFTSDGRVRIDRLKGDEQVLSIDESGYFCYNNINKLGVTSRDATVYRVELENGCILNVTSNHPVYTKHGWVVVGELRADDEILILQE